MLLLWLVAALLALESLMAALFGRRRGGVVVTVDKRAPVAAKR